MNVGRHEIAIELFLVCVNLEIDILGKTSAQHACHHISDAIKECLGGHK